MALSESRRTESDRVRSKIFDATSTRQVAETLFNQASLNDSCAGYAKSESSLQADCGLSRGHENNKEVTWDA